MAQSRPAGDPRAGPLAVARAVRRQRSVVLAGHGVADVDPEDDPENLCVAPERFRAQLELMLAAGFEFVTLGGLVDQIGADGPRPGLAALTFDDGMDNNHAVLAPILREYGLPATIYVATGLIGRPNPWLAPAARARMMTEQELLELDAAGVELGAHTVSHADLALLDLAACRDEIEGSRAHLQALLGHPVDAFAYPYFRFGPSALTAVREAGFASAVTGGGLGGWDPLRLERAMITGRDGTASFLAKLAGVYHPLHGSRDGVAARRLTRSTRRVVRGLRRPGARRREG